MRDRLARVAQHIDDVTSTPEALLCAFIVGILWTIWGSTRGYDATWANAGSNISGWVPFLMVFSIQFTQRVNNLSLHLKLDALNLKVDTLILAIKKAPNHVVGAEKKMTVEELESIHAEVVATAAF